MFVPRSGYYFLFFWGECGLAGCNSHLICILIYFFNWGEEKGAM